MEITSFSPGMAEPGSLVTVSGDFMMAWKSNWNPATSYSQNDVVLYSGKYYYSRFSGNTLDPLENGWDEFKSIYTFRIGTSLIDPTTINIINSNTLSFSAPTWNTKGLISFTRYKITVSSIHSYSTLYVSPSISSNQNVVDTGGDYFQILGSGFGNVAVVRINDNPVEFTVNNSNEILVSTPITTVHSMSIRTVDGGSYSEILSLGYGLSQPYGYHAYGY